MGEGLGGVGGGSMCTCSTVDPVSWGRGGAGGGATFLGVVARVSLEAGAPLSFSFLFPFSDW